MPDDSQFAVLAQGARARLDELRRVLDDAGFAARIVAPPDTKLNT